MKLRPLIIIAGPTASGKSDIALRLAKAINGAIINADSRQIYKELTIGTAKPTQEEMEGIHNYLYGTISVKTPYNLYQYQKDVFKILETIPEDKIPILVGGTGLYIDSVVYNYKLQESQPINHEKRKVLSSLPIESLKKMISEELLSKLNNSEKNNPRRLIRLIEKEDIQLCKEKPFPHIYFVIDIPQEELKVRIISRTEKMFKKGLENENRSLREDNLSEYLAFNTIGYKEFDQYFEGEKTLEEVKTDIINHTLQYAKRQRTWFRRNQDVIYVNNYDQILKETQNFLNHF